jgi:hypothetical protein
MTQKQNASLEDKKKLNDVFPFLPLLKGLANYEFVTPKQKNE